MGLLDSETKMSVLRNGVVEIPAPVFLLSWDCDGESLVTMYACAVEGGRNACL